MTDSKALIERLRDTACQGVELAIKNGRYVSPHEAADHIEKLEADNARLREAMKGPLAWLERWAVHVGNCKGDSACTCGLTFVQHELRAALQETSHDA